ncbi:MAG: hypothetical protein IPK80_25360 [Nannocystis sp.]|jgi:hypothetical protein|nr:hypothetical protein [Nannocystis sp.]
MIKSSYPRVVAAPQMPLSEVMARSSAQMSVPRATGGLCAAQPLQPHAFEIGDANVGLRLDPGCFTLLGLLDATVVSIRVSPQLDYVDAYAGAALLERCAALLDAATWERDGLFSAEQARVTATITGEALAGTWHARTWTTQLRLRRVHTAAGSPALALGKHHDLFLVTLSVSGAHSGCRAP